MQSIRYHSIKKQKETIVDFLSRRFLYHSSKEWLEKVQSGSVFINGKVETNASLILTHDQSVAYNRPHEEEPVVDSTHRVLYEDEAIMVVEKSGNIPISESGRYYKNTLINALKEKYNIPELYAVHRLDRETSGILVIAKEKEIATLMGEQFAEAKPKKLYHAVLKGKLDSQELLVDQPIHKVPKTSLVRIRQCIHEDGKSSQTKFTILRTTEKLSFVEIQTFTGRTHQIRVHSEWIGHPILGDKLYGQSDEAFLDMMKERKKPIFGEFGLIDHQLLHAFFLEFKHPISKEKVSFHSDSAPFFQKYEAVKKELF